MNPQDNVPQQVEEHLVDFAELLRTLGRYKWGVIVMTILATMVGLLYAYSANPIYRGTVTILIEARNQRVVQSQDVYDPVTGTAEYYATQGQILKSREIAERAVDRLRLVDHPEYAQADRQSVFELVDFRRFLPFLPTEEPLRGKEAEAAKREEVVQRVMDSTQVESIWGTQLVSVHFMAHSPQLSAQVANTLADLYIESGLQAKLDATRKANVWLTDKLSDIKLQVEKSEAALQAFREKAQIVTVGGAQNLTESEMVDYSQRLREAQKKRTELASAYEKVRQAGADPRKLREISSVLIDPFVQKASESMLAAQEAIKQAQERYGAKHPQMAAARARLETATAAFDEQLRVAAAGVRTSYEIAQQNERALQQQVELTRSKTQKLDRESYQLAALEREVESNRELYNTFLRRFKETDTSGTYESLNARIIDPAVVPRVKYEPRTKRIVLISAICGLLLGIFLAFVRFLLSESVHSAEELESLTNLPILSALPLASGIFGDKSKSIQPYLNSPKSPYAEGIRSTRAALQLSDVDRRFKRVMVTSSVPKEGKSSISCALAIALATNERVLLIDADLRLPAQHKLLSLPEGSKGLSDALKGDIALDECIHKFSAENMSVMSAGTAVPNPAELLSSHAFERLIDELSTRFDRIVFDSPPCQAASDALLISRFADTILFVVKSDDTSRRAIKNSLKRLQYAHASVLGLIVNQINVHKNNRYIDGYHYAYDYYGK